MKKLIILLILFASTSSFASTFVVYRTSSGEVVNITSEDIAYPAGMFTNIVDPIFIDGQIFQDPQGQRLVLGYTKIYADGVVRNATQQEIDGFESVRLDGYNQIEADKAIEYFQNHPQFRRIMTAYTDILIEYEINKYRKWFQDFAEQMALATSLANLQTRMAALAAANPMPDRELSQMRTQIINRISKDD